MKRLTKGMSVMLLLASLFLVSCEKAVVEEDGIEVSGQDISVSLAVCGEYIITSESPLSRAATPGVVYGIAKCTSVGQHATKMTGDFVDGSNYWWPEKLNNYATSNPTTLANLIEQYPNSNVETVFNTLPSEYGTDEKPGYPRDNFQNCWCKMTAIGVPGSGENDEQRYANGTIMSVSGGWVFGYASTSAMTCARTCAYGCADRVRAYAAFRQSVLTVR